VGKKRQFASDGRHRFSGSEGLSLHPVLLRHFLSTTATLLLLPLILADREGDADMDGEICCTLVGYPTDYCLGLTACVRSDRDILYPDTLVFGGFFLVVFFFKFTFGLI